MTFKQLYRRGKHLPQKKASVNRSLVSQDVQTCQKHEFKPGSDADRFCSVANIDYETGYSDAVPIEKLEEMGLGFGNGANWARGDGSLGRIFNISRPKKRGRIIAVQLMGYNKSIQSTGIPQFVRKGYKDAKCCVLYIGGNHIEIDHKDGRKDDFGVDANPSILDFQPMHKAVNIAKRQHCKDCASTGMRFDATRLGYSCAQWAGDHEYRGSCTGCYWHDPAVFNKKVSECYIHDHQ